MSSTPVRIWHLPHYLFSFCSGSSALVCTSLQCHHPISLTILFVLLVHNTNKNSAVAELAARCCSSQIVKRWGGSVFGTMPCSDKKWMQNTGASIHHSSLGANAPWKILRSIYTALHGKQIWSSDEKAVCPSVCLSVKRVNCDKSNPIQWGMTGAGRASLPASPTTINYIQTGRPPVPVKSQS